MTRTFGAVKERGTAARPAHPGSSVNLRRQPKSLLALANRFTCAIMKPEAWLQTLVKV